MTWGQLRLQLSTAAPSVSLDLLDEWLNTRYREVLEATDWTGRKAHASIQTAAAYQSTTDTVTLTVGSAAVTGVGTTWTAGITGRGFYRPGDTVTYTATQVSGTSLTLDRPYEGNGSDADGTVLAGSAYVFMSNVYPLPSDCEAIVTVLNPVTGFPMLGMSKGELDTSAGPRTRLGDPDVYAGYDDSPETSPPVLRQIELYPPPLRARGLPLQYLRAAIGFTGSNTTASPLPFVSDSVLLSGARANIATYMKDFGQVKIYKLEFEEELARLLRVEHSQRRTKEPLRMADRFTRHRMQRAARGWATNWRGGTPGGAN